ncbi:hypothetical protein ABIA31_002872 [Catenulispora sp. MAP5-51]
MRWYAVPATLNLVTPRGVSAGLAVLGIGWQPVPLEQSVLTTG